MFVPLPRKHYKFPRIEGRPSNVIQKHFPSAPHVYAHKEAHTASVSAQRGFDEFRAGVKKERTDRVLFMSSLSLSLSLYSAPLSGLRGVLREGGGKGFPSLTHSILDGKTMSSGGGGRGRAFTHNFYNEESRPSDPSVVH